MVGSSLLTVGTRARSDRKPLILIGESRTELSGKSLNVMLVSRRTYEGEGTIRERDGGCVATKCSSSVRNYFAHVLIGVFLDEVVVAKFVSSNGIALKGIQVQSESGQKAKAFGTFRYIFVLALLLESTLIGIHLPGTTEFGHGGHAGTLMRVV